MPNLHRVPFQFDSDLELLLFNCYMRWHGVIGTEGFNDLVHSFVIALSSDFGRSMEAIRGGRVYADSFKDRAKKVTLKMKTKTEQVGCTKGLRHQMLISK